MPLNLPSHAHGEGYADMNIVIRSCTQQVNYERSLLPDVGNYGSAGSAHLEYFNRHPKISSRWKGDVRRTFRFWRIAQAR